MIKYGFTIDGQTAARTESLVLMIAAYSKTVEDYISGVLNIDTEMRERERHGQQGGHAPQQLESRTHVHSPIRYEFARDIEQGKKR